VEGNSDSSEDQNVTVESLRPVALAAKVIEIRRNEKGEWMLVLKGLYRARILDISGNKYDQEGKKLLTKVKPLESSDVPLQSYENNRIKKTKDKTSEELKMKIVHGIETLLRAMPQSFKPAGYSRLTDQTLSILKMSDPEVACDVVGSALTKDYKERRYLLETVSIKERLMFVLDLLKSKVEAVKVASGGAIVNEVEEGSGGKTEELARIVNRIRSMGGSKEVMDVAKKEIKRIEKMAEHHPSHHTSMLYLENLGDIPWNVTTEKNASAVRLKDVSKCLNEDHYGMLDVKNRIIEFVAVKELQKQGKSSQAPVLCLIGPPGVGKSSIARSIAKALDKPFERISLGGVRDEAEIRGHRRTYIGAMPGRVISAMKKAMVSDPVLLLDEVDKTGTDARGDPASALLELLDPEQNMSFVDHYISVPFDFSKVTFIATANNPEQIPRPLLDRMELIYVTGYTLHEKLLIARRHLIPQSLTKNALNIGTLNISDENLQYLIESYTREAGVRGLFKAIDALCRHVAVSMVEYTEEQDFSRDIHAHGNEAVSGKQDSNGHLIPSIPTNLFHQDTQEDIEDSSTLQHFQISFDRNMIEKVLGPPRFDRHDSKHRVSSPGAAAGLVWTSVGGQVQYIECLIVSSSLENEEQYRNPTQYTSSSGTLKLTGRMGDVLNESAHIALSWIRGNCDKIPHLNKQNAHRANVHIHLPSGAQQKDGPSAGITLVVALVSLFTDTCARGDTALTGEISLRGHVLPIGGVREKVIAAHTAGLSRVILPSSNYKEAKKCIQDEKISNLSLIPVTTIEEVLSAAFDPPIILVPDSTDFAKL
jgi:ATP-dependent Lon protease